jgi:uncharacterized protein (DUF58 family)
MVKQYEMETNLVAHLLLDCSASMRYGQGDRQKLLYASRMAVALAHLIVEQLDKVSLALFDQGLREVLAPSNTTAQIIRMVELLDRTQPVEKTGIGAALTELAGRIKRRGIVIILSDLFVDLDDLERSLQRLRFDRQEVVLFQVLDHDEIHFELEGMIRFRGLEDLSDLLTRPEDVRAAYLEAFNRFNDRLARVCESNRCERLVCDTSRPMEELFADYLQKRSLIRRRW